jgi:hypothetical protein
VDKTRINLKGNIELDDEVAAFEIIFINSKFDGVYISGEYWHSIRSWDEFTKELGNEYYDSLADYKKDNVKYFANWIKENNLDTGSGGDE